MTQNERHIARIALDARTLDVLLRDGATVRVMGGIPRDAVLLGVHDDPARMCFWAMFEHPSFPACPLGTIPVQLPLTFEVLEHPMAGTYDMIPLRVGLDHSEYLDMRRWICERAAAIEGRDYP